MTQNDLDAQNGGPPTARVRPMGLRHLLLLMRLQRHGTTLHLERALIHPRTPLWRALTTPPFPWYDAGMVAYVLRGRIDGHSLRAIVQMQKRPARPEADLLFIAPALSQRAGLAPLWLQLLKHCSCEAKRYGIQRLYATLPEDPASMETLRAAGFSFYARDEIWRGHAAVTRMALPADTATTIRPFDKADDWALQRLYTTLTPRPVQLAEGRISGDEASQAPADGASIWVAEGRDGLVAALRLHSGTHGHWLQLLGNPQEVAPLRALLAHALAHPLAATTAPIYIGLREYQNPLREMLATAGFAPYGIANRLVKYNVALARTPVPKKVPALEATTEPTLTAMTDHTGEG